LRRSLGLGDGTAYEPGAERDLERAHERHRETGIHEGRDRGDQRRRQSRLAGELEPAELNERDAQLAPKQQWNGRTKLAAVCARSPQRRTNPARSRAGSPCDRGRCSRTKSSPCQFVGRTATLIQPPTRLYMTAFSTRLPTRRSSSIRSLISRRVAAPVRRVLCRPFRSESCLRHSRATRDHRSGAN
jgi:hypothetical protein